MLRIIRKRLHPTAQLGLMHTEIKRGLRIRHAPLLDQPHSLKLELSCKLPSLHDTPPVPPKHLTRCPRNRQQASSPNVTIKVIGPFNPTDETNVLKSSPNNSPGTSVGYGGTLQAFVPVTTNLYPNGNFDVVGFSAQSQSVRYEQYPTKSFDSV